MPGWKPGGTFGCLAGSSPVSSVMLESFIELHEAWYKLIREIKDTIGYILCEISFRIKVPDDCFDYYRNTTSCSEWNRLKIWFSRKLYHYGCIFYS